MALQRDGRDPYLPPSEGQIVHLRKSNNEGFEATGATKARKNSFPDTSLLYIPANHPLCCQQGMLSAFSEASNRDRAIPDPTPPFPAT